MNLLLDLGNTRLKWALSDGSALHGFGAQVHRGDPAGAFDSQSWPRVSAVWVASVMGAAPDRALAARVEARCGRAPRFAAVAAEHAGLRVAYAQPQRLGIDRWLTLLALWSQTRAAFCVASAGTALTFDAVDDRGQHLGGVIAPGLTAMQSATLASTRFETGDLSTVYDESLGTDTEACVRQGALHAVAGLIERLGARASGTRVLCGGDGARLQPHLASDWQQRPHLALEGLQVYANTPPA